MKPNKIKLKLISVASRISLIDQYNILNNINVNSFPKTGGTWICDELAKISGKYHKTGGSLKFKNTINRIHSLKKFPAEINIFRDPRDTYLSYYFFHKEPVFDNFNQFEIDKFKKIKSKYNLDGFDEEFSTFIKLVDKKKIYPYFSLNDFFMKKKTNIIKYEDMVLSPKKTLKKIIKYLKIDLKQDIDIDKKKEILKNSKENKTLFRSGIIGNWKKYFSKEHVKYFDTHYQEYMNSFKY